MKYSEQDIINIYSESLKKAEQKLSLLKVAEGRMPRAQGLNGWIFEQTIHYCLTQELSILGLQYAMQEQVSLIGKVKVDLLVGNVAVELKTRGSFGKSDSKYRKYRKIVEARGWIYMYLTQQERYFPYRKETETIFGANNTFFLDKVGDWERFVRAIINYQD